MAIGGRHGDFSPGGGARLHQPGRHLRSSHVFPRLAQGRQPRPESACGSLPWPYFWVWWFQPGHIHTLGRWLLVTFILGWITLIPFYYIALFARARLCPATDARALPGTPRVRNGGDEGAVGTFRDRAPHAPGRARLLLIILTRSLPRSCVGCGDSASRTSGSVTMSGWADEDPSAGDARLVRRARACRSSCRKGIPEYHRPQWPRRTRGGKEGILSCSLILFITILTVYNQYDFVAQWCDAGYIPQPDLPDPRPSRRFTDEAVGYVSAPSICVTNGGRELGGGAGGCMSRPACTVRFRPEI